MKDITFLNTINRIKFLSCAPFIPKLADLAEHEYHRVWHCYGD